MRQDSNVPSMVSVGSWKNLRNTYWGFHLSRIHLCYQIWARTNSWNFLIAIPLTIWIVYYATAGSSTNFLTQNPSEMHQNCTRWCTQRGWKWQIFFWKIPKISLSRKVSYKRKINKIYRYNKAGFQMRLAWFLLRTEKIWETRPQVFMGLESISDIRFEQKPIPVISIFLDCNCIKNLDCLLRHNR